MIDPFDTADAIHALAETVDIVQMDGVREIHTPVPGVVIVGAGLNSAAGSQVHPDTADRYSVVIGRTDISAIRPLAFGDRIFVARFGRLDVKQVTVGEHEVTVRCTRNMVGGLP